MHTTSSRPHSPISRPAPLAHTSQFTNVIRPHSTRGQLSKPERVTRLSDMVLRACELVFLRLPVYESHKFLLPFKDEESQFQAFLGQVTAKCGICAISEEYQTFTNTEGAGMRDTSFSLVRRAVTMKHDKSFVFCREGFDRHC